MSAPQRPCANCSRPLPADSATQRHYCEDGACKRERARKRKRKSRGAQWVLVNFKSNRNESRELREHTIVDLDLSAERDLADPDQAPWDDFITAYLIFTAGRRGERFPIPLPPQPKPRPYRRVPTEVWHAPGWPK